MQDIKAIIKEHIQKALRGLGVEEVTVNVEHPADSSHGDYATNVAMVAMQKIAQKVNVAGVGTKSIMTTEASSPFGLAKKIVEKIKKSEKIEKIEVAPPGFINFHLSRDFFAGQVGNVLKEGDSYGKNDLLKDKKIMVEFTDPNPFKEFHIGHMMSNIIGESISRLIQFSGAEVKRANYFGDVGIHVANALWGMQQMIKEGKQVNTPQLLGQAYARGATAYKEDEQAKQEITELNKAIYERSDEDINKLYDTGKKISLDHFETIYEKLGTEFDYYIPESEVSEPAKKIVTDALEKGIFEESDGAVVFRAETHDPKLHTRVFLNAKGLPVYEAKDLANAQIKYNQYPYDVSIIVTGNEIKEYFRVVLMAMQQLYPEFAEKTLHMPHGMLTLPAGKMSSRTGNVITAEGLIENVEEALREKMQDTHSENTKETTQQIAIGALKYSILKQSIGKNVVFDTQQSLSFEGDSGPYLQYTHARARSVLQKAEKESLTPSITQPIQKTTSLERLLYQFPEVVLQASREYAPHRVVTFLTQLSSTFNTFYAQEKIVDTNNPHAPYNLALTQAVATILKNGLWILGIKAPEHM